MINLKRFSKQIDWDALYFEAFDKNLCFYDITKEFYYSYEENIDKEYVPDLSNYPEAAKLLSLLKEDSIFHSKIIRNSFEKMGWHLIGSGCSRATYGHEKRKVVINDIE